MNKKPRVMPVASWLEIGALLLTIGVASLIGWGMEHAAEPGSLSVAQMTSTLQLKG